MSQTTSINLLHALQRQDGLAWSRFHDSYSALILYWVLQQGVGHDHAEDLVQEILTVVHRKIGDFEKQQGVAKFRGWLKTITRNLVIDFWRKQKITFSPAISPESLAQPTDHLNDSDSAVQIQNELTILVQKSASNVKTRLREKTWLSFWRTAVDGLDASVVAEELELTSDAVRKNKSRVTQALKREMTESAIFDFLDQ